MLMLMWVGSRLPLSVVWDSKTFNIHNLQLTTSMLSVYLMMENKTHTSYRTRAFHLCVFQLRVNLGSWEIKNERWIDWRSSPSSQQTGSSGRSMGDTDLPVIWVIPPFISEGSGFLFLSMSAGRVTRFTMSQSWVVYERSILAEA